MTDNNLDFDLFMEADEQPDSLLSMRAKQKIEIRNKADLTRTSSIRFVMIQLVGFIATLAVCPQFGISWNESVAHFIHNFLGHNSILCGVFCSFIYCAFCLSLQLVLLNPYQRNALSQKIEWMAPTTGISVLLCAMVLGKGGFNFDASFTYIFSWLFATTFFLWRGTILIRSFDIRSFRNS